MNPQQQKALDALAALSDLVGRWSVDPQPTRREDARELHALLLEHGLMVPPDAEA